MRLSFCACWAAFAFAACASKNEPGGSACADAEFIVAASDYSSSAVGAAKSQGLSELASGVDLGGDPALAASRGRVFFLARDHDLVFELDPSCGAPIARFSVHDLAPRDAKGIVTTANPQDVAAAPDGSLLVPLYNTPAVAIVRDGHLERTIELSSFDSDSNPQATSVRIVDVGGSPKAFVALERLDDKAIVPLVPKDSAQMLRIDVQTGAIEATTDLAARNPFNTMAEQDGFLFLAAPDGMNAANDALAGIERFDTKTATTKLLVPETSLGASAVEIAVSAGCGAVILRGPEVNVNPTSLALFDPDSGELFAVGKTSPLATDGYDLQGLLWQGNKLYVGDRRQGADGYRVHVFEREAGRCAIHETSQAIRVPQPPVALRAKAR